MTLRAICRELFVVPKAGEHEPIAENECHRLSIEPAGTVNRGELVNALTAANENGI